MKQIRFTPTRIAAALALGAAILTGAAASAWASPPWADGPARQEWTKQRQEWMRARLDRAANRLEIKSSQQEAWQAFVKVVEQPVDLPARKADAAWDAAAMSRWHADMSAARAKKAVQVADATAKLQEVLTPEQRKTLDQLVQRMGHRGHRHMMRGGDWMGDGTMGRGMGPRHMDGPGYGPGYGPGWHGGRW